MSQQLQPLIKYIKSKEFDALIEEYYHPIEKDAKGDPVFLDKRAIVSRDEWIKRRADIEKAYKEKVEFFDNVIFKILDEKEEPKKGKKK